MKSLLVDVLRQANGGSPDKTLSDSGSFDTTQHEFPDTANDPVVDDTGSPDEGLALFETTTSAHATDIDGDASFPEVDDFLAVEDDDAHDPVPAANVARHRNASDKGPVVARFAPLACIVLAFLTAALWAGYQTVKLKYAESQFAGAEIGHSAEYVSALAGKGDTAAVERFPFLGANNNSDTEKAE